MADVASEGFYGNYGDGFRDNQNGFANQGNFNSTYDSPGWKRAETNRAAMRERGPIIEAKAKKVVTAEPVSDFSVGERIFHQKFGYGKITAVEGNKLEISFDKAGAKKVLDSFVQRA